MAAEKRGQTIIIKKIYPAAGGHGGAWKVALADFMTAMMAFFLVMWLLNQSEETKKAVSDYFSTPSIIEYNFQNFGVEITLEKLFLDLVNEPLKAFQQFLEPSDKTPNLLDMGSQKVVTAFMADKLQDIAYNVNVTSDGYEFDIFDKDLFTPGTANLLIPQFVTQMDRISTITAGLKDAKVKIESRLFNQSVKDNSHEMAKKVAEARLDLVRNKIQSSFEHSSVDISGEIQIRDKKNFVEGQSQRPMGMIHISIKQKDQKSDGTKYRKLEKIFGDNSNEMNVYDNFVKQITDRKAKREKEYKDSVTW